MTITSLSTKSEVRALVEHLRGPGRTRPVAVISTPNKNPVPLISISDIDSVAGHIADIVLIETGPLTFEFTDHMVDGTQVYGGAGRVYPVGTDWEQDLSLSPLRFAYEAADGRRAASRLIDDAFNCHRGGHPPAALVNRLGDDNAAALTAARTRAVSATRAKQIPAAKTRPSGAQLTVAMMAQPVAVASAPRPGSVRASPTSAQPVVVAAAVAEPTPADAEVAKLRRQLADAHAELAEERRSAATDQAILHARETLAARTGPIPVQKQRDQQPSDSGLLVENATLQRQLSELRTKHAEQIAAAKKKSGKVTDTTAAVLVYDPELFLDPADAVRHAVAQTWAQRVPATEKARHPIAAYAIGADFAASLEKLDEGQMSKAFRCVVDIVSDLVRNLPARRLHVLRTGIGGDGQPLTRADGAVCFRASIEKNTSSARRLHYWKLTDGSIELSRVVLHEDVQP